MTLRLTTGARWAALATVAVVSAAFVPSIAHAEDTALAPSGKVTLDVQTVNGSGCPAGTATVTMLSGNTGFKIKYSAFRAENGGSAAPTALRKNCQINLNVNIPQGFTLAVSSATYTGKANLTSGSTATVRTNYYYQGSTENSFEGHDFTGPYNGTWRATDVTADADLVWADCGEQRNLNINSELIVHSATNSKSWISMRTAEGDVYTIVNFAWKTC